MSNIVEDLTKEANDKIQSGYELSVKEGKGMMRVLNDIGKYYHAFQEYDCYFDSIDDEEKKKLHIKLQKLEIY